MVIVLSSCYHPGLAFIWTRASKTIAQLRVLISQKQYAHSFIWVHHLVLHVNRFGVEFVWLSFGLDDVEDLHLQNPAKDMRPAKVIAHQLSTQLASQHQFRGSEGIKERIKHKSKLIIPR